VNDRLSDGIVLGALLIQLAREGETLAAALCLAALVASLSVSHVRAQGEAAGVDMAGGLFQRLERYVALMVGLTAPGALVPVLAILTGLGAFTTVQRAVHAWRRLPPAEAETRA
jgi:phosphatidylglycerophosphate synthase